MSIGASAGGTPSWPRWARKAAFLAVGWAAAAGLVAARPAATAATTTQASAPAAAGDAGVTLNIPARPQAPERPKEGWCGEAAIQSALLYQGMYVSQKEINRAGTPDHPDLYAQDLPKALRTLKAQFEMWDNRSADVKDFMAWLQRQIQQGRPVLAGVKINPTKTPTWILDHFVLVVGFTQTDLLFDNTWGQIATRPRADMLTTAKGLGFKNPFGRHYGICISGPARPAGGLPVRLRIKEEKADKVELLIRCEGLTPGRRYALIATTGDDPRATRPVRRFRADSPEASFTETVRKGDRVAYDCRGE